MTRKNLRVILLILGASLAFLPRILLSFFNINLDPLPHTIIFVGAVIILIAGMMIPKDSE